MHIFRFFFRIYRSSVSYCMCTLFIIIYLSLRFPFMFTFEEFVDFLVTTTFRNLPKFWINCEQRGFLSREGLDHVLI